MRLSKYKTLDKIARVTSRVLLAIILFFVVLVVVRGFTSGRLSDLLGYLQGMCIIVGLFGASCHVFILFVKLYKFEKTDIIGLTKESLVVSKMNEILLENGREVGEYDFEQWKKRVQEESDLIVYSEPSNTIIKHSLRSLDRKVKERRKNTTNAILTMIFALTVLGFLLNALTEFIMVSTGLLIGSFFLGNTFYIKKTKNEKRSTFWILRWSWIWDDVIQEINEKLAEMGLQSIFKCAVQLYDELKEKGELKRTEKRKDC